MWGEKSVWGENLYFLRLVYQKYVPCVADLIVITVENRKPGGVINSIANKYVSYNMFSWDIIIISNIYKQAVMFHHLMWETPVWWFLNDGVYGPWSLE